MNDYLEIEARKLLEDINERISSAEFYKLKRNGENINVAIPEEIKSRFFRFIDKINFNLMEDKDNFYGYFIFQMEREINFNISNATGINFKGAKYVIYFNPIIFLNLNGKQMESSIKHEIHHILSWHLVRSRKLKGKYSTLAINLAMDIVVNQYLSDLAPYAVTLKSVNMKYSLSLKPYNTFEYYVERIQNELYLLEESDEGLEDDSKKDDGIEREFDANKTHLIWEDNITIEDNMLMEFTKKYIYNAEKGQTPDVIKNMIHSLKNMKGELPWNLYLKKLMGTVESGKKKTITRRNRRQPYRLDLRGELNNHKAEIVVAIDISGSISDEEFQQAVKEVINIVKNYNREITIIECDNKIRTVYKVKSIRDLRKRSSSGGGTKFTPVVKYCNNKNIDLLIYFTDGKGERNLDIEPRRYKILWVISGRGDKLSLIKSYGGVKRLSNIEVKDVSIDMKDVRNDGYSMNNQEPMF